MQHTKSPTMERDPSEYKLTVSDAAYISGFSVTSIRRFADAGILPALLTPGKHRRFHPDDLASLLRPTQAN